MPELPDYLIDPNTWRLPRTRETILAEDTQAMGHTQQRTLMLEVLLDIRDLLMRENRASTPPDSGKDLQGD